MNILLVCGGISTERDISLKSGRAVFRALLELNHNVLGLDPALGKDGFFSSVEEMERLPNFETLKNQGIVPKNYLESFLELANKQVDVAFIALHGKYGEDGIVQSYLETLHIPYTGSGVKASSIAIDKHTSKILFSAAGISTPRWLLVNRAELGSYEFYEYVREELGKAVVIKPNDQGSTIGVSIVFDGNLDDIHIACEKAFELSSKVLIEQYIEGREVTVGVLGREPLPVIEIVPQSGFYDFEHKYTVGRTEYVCPAEIDEYTSEFIQQVALNAFEVLDCSGFARVDFRLTEEGVPFALELNTIPGFTETSLVPKAAKQIGIEFPELCQKIIDLALGIENEQ